MRSALYALVEMIEKLDSNGGFDNVDKNICLALNEGEFSDLKKLLDILKEIEQFYDCIGGIIG